MTGAVLLSNYLIGADSINSEIYLLDVENPKIKRKFLPHIESISDDSFFVCWEEGPEEINNNTIACRIYNKDFSSFKNVNFKKPKKELRYFPVDIIKIDTSVYLYFMEMDIRVYNRIGVSSLKRAQLVSSADTLIIDNRPIWETTLGAGMHLLPFRNQYLLPIYEQFADKKQTPSLKVISLNKQGVNISAISTIKNPLNINVFEPSIAVGRNDSAIMIIRSNEKKHLLYATSSDGGLNWSPIKESNIKSPGSISRIFYTKEHFFIIHNNSQNGSRNSLDITVVTAEMDGDHRTFNLLSDSKDFFSNFSVYVEGNTVYIPYQRLMRSGEHKPALDRVEMIMFNIHDILRLNR